MNKNRVSCDGLSALVVSGSAHLAFNVATCLADAGHRVRVLGSWQSSTFNLSRHWRGYDQFDRRAFTDQDEGRALAERIDRICRDHQINLVVPADVAACMVIQRHGERITSAKLFPVPGYESFRRLHDKWRFALLAESCGAAHPKTRLIEKPADADAVDLPFPLVVKPLLGTSSRGVYKVESPQQLRRYADRCAARGELPIIAQFYFEGEDCDLTILADHGRVVAWTFQRRRLAESTMIFEDQPRALAECEKVIAAAGYHGMVDFDMRWDHDADRFMIIEANPRFPGTLRFKLWAGVNFPAMGAELAMGGTINGQFVPTTGPCKNHGISPKHLARALAHGRLTPPDFRGHTANAWRNHWSDPLPHLASWVYKLLKRRDRTPPRHIAEPLPE